ncbi:hypothetical protein HZA97_00475 [Candidatus Woesearchaeota archaeon]|nr:hypothetical protein [Candidatus Woesearchaeota archaeon]
MKKVVLFLLVFLLSISVVFSKSVNDCPSDKEIEFTRFVLTGEVLDVSFNESVAGADYYVAKIKIEELREGKYLQGDTKQRISADSELEKLKTQGFVEFKFASNKAEFSVGEKVKVYLRADFYSNVLRLNFESCGKVILEKASLFDRFMGNNYLAYSFVTLVAVILFVFMMRKFSK